MAAQTATSSGTRTRGIDRTDIGGKLEAMASRKAIVRYWERRRILYNIALIPPSLFAYMLTAAVIYVGDPHKTHYYFLAFWFGISAIGANICYSFVYALEFFFGTDDQASRWHRFGRAGTFIAGVVFAALLALVGGRNIAMMEFHQFGHGPQHRENWPQRDHTTSADAPRAFVLAPCGKSPV